MRIAHQRVFCQSQMEDMGHGNGGGNKDQQQGVGRVGMHGAVQQCEIFRVIQQPLIQSFQSVKYTKYGH